MNGLRYAAYRRVAELLVEQEQRELLVLREPIVVLQQQVPRICSGHAVHLADAGAEHEQARKREHQELVVCPELVHRLRLAADHGVAGILEQILDALHDLRDILAVAAEQGAVGEHHGVKHLGLGGVLVAVRVRDVRTRSSGGGGHVRIIGYGDAVEQSLFERR